MSAPEPDRAGVPTPVPLTVVGDTPQPERPALTPIRGLLDQHRREIVDGSGVDPEVAAERGYFSLARPTNTNTHDGPEQRLKATGIPRWARDNHSRLYPGWVAPIYRPTGERASLIWKPKNPATHPSGRKVKYIAPTGHPTHLDVHPRWSRTGAIVDPTIPLWITEGVKKADALTSRGICTIALSGVYMWRNRLATLGDWEDVQLRGREVWIAFDADAATNPNVQRAMIRLGRWLRSKHVAKVVYLIPPAELNGTPTKGVDDFLVAGGTVDQLQAAGTTRPPRPDLDRDTFTDARMAETVATDVLEDRFCWVTAPDGGRGRWLRHDGMRWAETSPEVVTEQVRRYMLDRFAEAAKLASDEPHASHDAELNGWKALTSRARLDAVERLARGVPGVIVEWSEFDTEHHLLNTPGGVVDLRCGSVRPHSPADRFTKVTLARYRPGYRHPDWDAALTALPEADRRWAQTFTGSAITGEQGSGDRVVLMHGDGSNGKSLLIGAGVGRALGDYFHAPSAKFLTAGEHSTEIADLRGKRLVLAEELAEGGRLDMTAVKRITDTEHVTARRVYRENVSFDPTHTLVMTANTYPALSENGHGSRRRLMALPFRVTFRKPGEAVGDNDRSADLGLKARLRDNAAGQLDAALTWAVEGAVRWYATRHDPESVELVPTAAMAAATAEWHGRSDTILAFWRDRLVADPDACVLRSDLYAAYVEFMAGRGARPVTEKAFPAEFGQHDASIAAEVTAAQPRTPAGLSLLPGTTAPETRQVRVWAGIRFQAPEQGKSEVTRGDTG